MVQLAIQPLEKQNHHRGEKSLAKHPLIATLLRLRGNPRACVYTEPLWGIPFNLYAPYVSVYMLALGVTDSQIGLIASVSIAFQVVMALISGAITDKLGRRLTTTIFDFISWSVPCLLWAAAQNFTWFLVAGVINSLWRIPMNSWNLLLVEDAEEDHLVHIYVWVYISGLFVAFFAPLAGILVARFSLIPTMRGLYLFAFAMMTFKFLILYRYSTETRQGKVRLEESRSEPFFAVLKGYRNVLGQILRSPSTMYALGVMLVIGIATMINSNFWGVIVTQKLNFPASSLAIFSFVKSIFQLVLFFGLTPRLSSRNFRRPMLSGFGAFLLSQVILVTMPEKSYVLLVASTILEAVGLILIRPVLDALVVMLIDPAERARIMAILGMAVLALTSPFGWVAGKLSEIDRALPFALNLGLFALGAWFVMKVAREQKRKEEPGIA